MAFFHWSDSKAQALEDTLMFFPELFQLQRSLLYSKAYSDILPRHGPSYVLSSTLSLPGARASTVSFSPDIFLRGSPEPDPV